MQEGDIVELGEGKQGLFIQCYGRFEVYFDGVALHFPRKKAKEALALLVDREGKEVSNQELCDILWPDIPYDRQKQRNYFHHIYSTLYKTLSSVGCGDVLIHAYDSYAVDSEKIACDYYEDSKKPEAQKKPLEYMKQYPWAKGKIPALRKED